MNVALCHRISHEMVPSVSYSLRKIGCIIAPLGRIIAPGQPLRSLSRSDKVYRMEETELITDQPLIDQLAQALHAN